MPSVTQPLTPRRLAPRTVTVAAVAVFAVLGVVWALATPLMDAPDEPTHALRAAAVWRGTLHGADRVVHEPPAADGSVVTGTLTEVEVPRAYVDLQQMPECYKFKRHVTADCAPAVGTDETMVSAATYTGTYQPTYYVLVGWPSRLFGPYRALYAMRVVSALLGSVLLGLGVRSAYRAARTPFAVVGAALAATPMAIFLTGTVNPSGLEIAAGLATWLGLLELVRRPGRPPTALLVQVAATASLFAATRPLSPLFLGVMGGLLLLASLDRSRLVELRTDRRVLAAGGAIVAVTALSAAWVVSTHAYDAFTGVSIPGLTHLEAARRHVDMLPFRARQIIGYFGQVDAPLPDAFIWAWYAAVLALVGAALWLGRWRQRLAVLGTVAVALLVPLASEVSRAATYGFIWQGRYSLPTAVGVPILAGWVVADALGADGRDRLGRAGRRNAAGAVAVGVALTQVVAHLVFMTRVAVGYPDEWWTYLTEARWAPPVSVWLLLPAVVVASAAYAALLWSTGRDEPAPVPAPERNAATSEPDTSAASDDGVDRDRALAATPELDAAPLGPREG